MPPASRCWPGPPGAGDTKKPQKLTSKAQPFWQATAPRGHGSLGDRAGTVSGFKVRTAYTSGHQLGPFRWVPGSRNLLGSYYCTGLRGQPNLLHRVLRIGSNSGEPRERLVLMEAAGLPGGPGVTRTPTVFTLNPVRGGQNCPYPLLVGQWGRSWSGLRRMARRPVWEDGQENSGGANTRWGSPAALALVPVTPQNSLGGRQWLHPL